MGDALHALQGHADPRAVPSSVPHLSPSALEGATRRARSVASALDDAAAVADVVLHPARSAVANGFETTGPTTRACATAVLGMTRECRDALAPMLQRAAGTGGGAGAPTLLEVRARVSAVAERARALASLARAALPAPKDGATPSAAASRCLTALARAAAAWQTSPGVGAGFVVADAALVRVGAAATSRRRTRGSRRGRWTTSPGSFSCARGRRAGRRSARRRTGSAGSNSGEDGWANPSVPSFSRRAPREIFAAGKAARLMRAEDRPGWIAREDSETGSREEGDAGTFPTARRHLCVEFCRRARAALETGAAFRDDDDDEDEDEDEEATRTGHETEDAVEDDDSVEMLRGTSLEAFPSRPGPGVARSTRDSAFASTEETATLLACGLAGSTTRVVAFVGERVEWGGAPFRRSAAAAAAASLDAWLSSSEETLASATCPVGTTLAAAAVAPARARAAAVGAALMARLRGRWRLRRCLESLRAVYLGGAGEATASFSAAVFRRLDACDDDPLDPAELNVALAEAIAADESGTLPDARDVSVEVASGSAPRSGSFTVAGEGAARLAELARIRVRVRVPWPLTLVIPESSLERYADAGAFLMQLRAARAALEETATSGWTAAARRAPGGGGGRLSRASTRRRVSTLRRRAARTRRHARAARVLGGSRRGGGPRGDAEGGEGGARGVSRRRVSAVPGVPGPDVDAVGGADARGARRGVRPRRRASKDGEGGGGGGAGRGSDGGTVRGGDVGCGERGGGGAGGGARGVRTRAGGEAERLASAFRRARSYVLRVVESKLKIGSFPELAELRLRLDFNGFYGTKDRGGGESKPPGGGRRRRENGCHTSIVASRVPNRRSHAPRIRPTPSTVRDLTSHHFSGLRIRSLRICKFASIRPPFSIANAVSVLRASARCDRGECVQVKHRPRPRLSLC